MVIDVLLLRGSQSYNVSIQVSVLADDIPELDETFQLELFNVSGRNERLRNGAVSCVFFFCFCVF